MIGDWMTTDVSEVSQRLICSPPQKNLTRLLSFLPLCEGIPVASHRSVVSSVQYPPAESDGRAAMVLDHAGGWHTHTLSHLHTHTDGYTLAPCLYK